MITKTLSYRSLEDAIVKCASSYRVNCLVETVCAASLCDVADIAIKCIRCCKNVTQDTIEICSKYFTSKEGEPVFRYHIYFNQTNSVITFERIHDGPDTCDGYDMLILENGVVSNDDEWCVMNTEVGWRTMNTYEAKWKTVEGKSIMSWRLDEAIAKAIIEAKIEQQQEDLNISIDLNTYLGVM